jgi:hypothetical protein
MTIAFLLANIIMVSFGVYEVSRSYNEYYSYILLVSPALNLYIAFMPLEKCLIRHLVESFRLNVEIKSIEQEIAIKNLSQE